MPAVIFCGIRKERNNVMVASISQNYKNQFYSCLSSSFINVWIPKLKKLVKQEIWFKVEVFVCE